MSTLIKEEIEDIRDLLGKLVSAKNAIFNEGKILELSKELDILIAEYYKESSI